MNEVPQTSQSVFTPASGEGEQQEAPVLKIEGLRKEFAKRSLADLLAKRDGVRTLALDDVSLSIAPREALALVGESGSGKTTLARSLVRLVDPDAGSIEFHGSDILKCSRGDLSSIRRRIQLIYQDPYSSLNSAIKIGDAIIEPALVHHLVDKAGAASRLEELLGHVGLGPTLARRYPRALSGGQRQRVAIARALAAEPEILIADEAVSALDVSVQAQVIRLFARLRAELGLTLIFVSHQLATVAQLCERVAIMYRGQLVELGPTAEVFARPRHGYTAALIGAHPGGRRLRARMNGAAAPSPAPSLQKPGCPFQHRCAFAAEICAHETPPPVLIAPGHVARCHVLPHDLDLAASAGVRGRDTPA
ncbi:MAG TPA: ABC transporter ATP-binding protein [Solirubrobacteraceae bacterium]|jgi:oligopeptide/dipeptide ABC transporter ATP-binding protein|nr:ABC transporter ATP-binding protein [Solirubrobacteraceae bacterium]